MLPIANGLAIIPNGDVSFSSIIRPQREFIIYSISPDFQTCVSSGFLIIVAS